MKKVLFVVIGLLVVLLLAGNLLATPARILTLTASATGPNSISVEVPVPVGTGLTQIDLRYRTGESVITANWISSTQVTGEPVPVSGKTVYINVTGLQSGTSYCFGEKTKDTVFSLVSNSVCVNTLDSMAAVNLTWDPNSEPDLAGYKIYRGPASGTYNTTQILGEVTTAKFFLNRGWTYYFAATAYNDNGLESGFSNEVVYTAPTQ